MSKTIGEVDDGQSAPFMMHQSPCFISGKNDPVILDRGFWPLSFSVCPAIYLNAFCFLRVTTSCVSEEH